jgi:hypothetical protein
LRYLYRAPIDAAAFPHRYWTGEIMRRIANENWERVVFVGLAQYTHHYERPFAGRVTDYITIDPMPKARTWGARHHIVDDIVNLGTHLPPGSVDALIFVGIYGLYLKTEAQLATAFEAIHLALKPGGLMVFNWNTDIADAPEPTNSASLNRLFRPTDALGMPARKQIEGRPTVFGLYRAV